MAAAGADPDKLEIPLLQFVHLVEGGERASMSKRRGEFITLDDLIDEIGVDATRFFMLQRSHDSTIDLDLDLARQESAENPVYYVQYAHARIASVLRKAGREPEMPTGDLELHPAERELIKKLLAFPAEAAEAAERRAPHRIATYALELAQTFTAFYRDCKVVGVEPRAGRVVPARPLRGDAADHRAGAGPARRVRARVDVDHPLDGRPVAAQARAERAGDGEGGLVGRHHLEHEARDAAAAGVGLELAHQQAAEAAAVDLVGDRERDVGDGRRLGAPQVAGGADDASVAQGDEADVAVAVDVAQRVEHPLGQLGGHAGEEALVAGARGELGEEVREERPVLAGLGSDRDVRAVAEGHGEHASRVRDARGGAPVGKTAP